jgi:uncharacterized membrane protein (DUF4010 family)
VICFKFAGYFGGGTAVLLHFKGQLHDAVARVSDNDLKPIMQFALISLVILPVLPNRTYVPYAGSSVILVEPMAYGFLYL